MDNRHEIVDCLGASETDARPPLLTVIVLNLPVAQRCTISIV
jgi:hypothetical protein